MIKIIRVIILLLIFTGCNENSKMNMNNHAQVECIAKHIELGEVAVNTLAKCIFDIKNVGEIPYCIYDVETSCGCTDAKWDKNLIKPGETTHISVSFWDKDPGIFYKTINVFGNSKEVIQLTISGKLIR